MRYTSMVGKLCQVFFSQLRKKDKKPRRITLTSMQQQLHQSSTSSPAHFAVPLNTSESWSSHPAFVVEEITSSVPSPLSEERRLLRKERSRQLKKSSGSATKCSGTHTEIEFTPSPFLTSQTTNSVPCSGNSPDNSGNAGPSVLPSTTVLGINTHQQPRFHSYFSFTMVSGSI